MSQVEQPPSDALSGRLGEPPEFTFPEGWTLSGAWQRAQCAESHFGAVDDAHFDVLLERESGDCGETDDLARVGSRSVATFVAATEKNSRGPARCGRDVWVQRACSESSCRQSVDSRL
jgi:hypothetical protein